MSVTERTKGFIRSHNHCHKAGFSQWCYTSSSIDSRYLTICQFWCRIVKSQLCFDPPQSSTQSIQHFLDISRDLHSWVIRQNVSILFHYNNFRHIFFLVLFLSCIVFVLAVMSQLVILSRGIRFHMRLSSFSAKLSNVHDSALLVITEITRLYRRRNWIREADITSSEDWVSKSIHCSCCQFPFTWSC